MADSETIEALIAEMRKTYVSKGGAGYCGEVWIDLLRYADRLEAAHKRELSKNVSKSGADFGQLVDAAKLREALCEILSYIESFHKYIIPGKREKTTAIFAVADTIRGKARAALAAPPRNCDRPECATTKAAQDVWRREDGGKTAYYEWLLATYKEGGNDGR